MQRLPPTARGLLAATRQLLWPPQQQQALAAHAAAANVQQQHRTLGDLAAAPQQHLHAQQPLQLCCQHHQQQPFSQHHQQQPGWQLQQARGMAIVVNVTGNKVDGALGKLNKLYREAGMVQEARKREHRRTSAEVKFAANRAGHNKRVGALIASRLKWVVRRRKLKV